MASLGKKILSAFVEVNAPGKTAGPEKGSPEKAESSKRGDDVDKRSEPVRHEVRKEEVNAGAAYEGPAEAGGSSTVNAGGTNAAADPRMMEYFDKLFSEANIPGPDYFEFSKMVAALKAVPDEFSRFCAAYAGLQVQGLTKEKLVSTAEEYLRVLDTDAQKFQATVDAALQEKVHGKKAEAEEKSERIRNLSREISDLQGQITSLQAEIRESEQKINGRSVEYSSESNARQRQIAADIEKIKQYIHQR